MLQVTCVAWAQSDQKLVSWLCSALHCTDCGGELCGQRVAVRVAGGDRGADTRDCRQDLRLLRPVRNHYNISTA